MGLIKSWRKLLRQVNWFAGCPRAPSQNPSGAVQLPHAPQHDACACPRPAAGQWFCMQHGRATPVHTAPRPSCRCLLPFCPPHTLQHPTSFGMAGSGIAGMGIWGRLWDARMRTALVPPRGCGPPPVLVLR
eukprot:272854-Chlamydomonas_euryale.AAC.7